MNFFIIVTFVMATISPDRPVYIFQNPNFETYESCKEYVQVMNGAIYSKAVASYNYKLKPEAIYCVNEDAVKELFNYNYDKHDTKKQNI